jgi:two-component system, OmpR family, response regulator VicR
VTTAGAVVKTLTVLVVEDERPVRELLAMSLEGGGYRVVQAFHGRHAIDLIARDRPDLVISDVMMPMIGGVELCHTLKSDPATATIPVVLMSAAGLEAGRAAPADAVVAKPFDLDAMDALVHRLLHQVRS